MPKEKAAKPAKKEKKVKDPNAPKKPVGAYMWFCKEFREEVKAGKPDLKVTEIGSRLGAMWKEFPEEDKKRFYTLAEQDKTRYQKDLAAYKAE